jgi:hypothetical protein
MLLGPAPPSWRSGAAPVRLLAEAMFSKAVEIHAKKDAIMARVH